MSHQTFADLGVSKAVCRALEARGMESPFPIQRLVIADVLAGHDVLAESPTGSGKTLAFGVPALDRIDAEARRPAGLVLAPTRELALQIVEELSPLAGARALSVAAVYGGAGLDKQAKAARRAHLLVATPGRLQDLLDRREVTLDHVRILVLDEADRMLDMGFKPQVDKIVDRIPGRRQTLFFSATLEGASGEAARAYTRSPRRHTVAPTPVRDRAIEHRFVAVRRDERISTLTRELRDGDGPTLVFVRTKRGADRLVKQLRRQGIEAAPMHGDRSQRQRERALAAFASGQIPTLVATDVAARGIDVDGIAHVINYDPPGDADTYTHRIGRTGRAGRTGTGTTFVTEDAAVEVGEIADRLLLENEWKSSGLRAVVEDEMRHRGRGHGRSPGRQGSSARQGSSGRQAPTGRTVAKARGAGGNGRRRRAGGRGR